MDKIRSDSTSVDVMFAAFQNDTPETNFVVASVICYPGSSFGTRSFDYDGMKALEAILPQSGSPNFVLRPSYSENIGMIFTAFSRIAISGKLPLSLNACVSLVNIYVGGAISSNPCIHFPSSRRVI